MTDSLIPRDSVGTDCRVPDEWNSRTLRETPRGYGAIASNVCSVVSPSRTFLELIDNSEISASELVDSHAVPVQEVDVVSLG